MVNRKLECMHWFSDSVPEFVGPFEGSSDVRHVLVDRGSSFSSCYIHLTIKYHLSFIELFFIHLEQDGILVLKVSMNQWTIQQRAKAVKKLEEKKIILIQHENIILKI